MSNLSVRTRFEVFKRDRFTCQYCGKTPPDVLLEVDHIIPRAAGGGDEITNLTTACKECNRGKSDKLLEEGTAPTVSRQAVDEIRERLEQAAAYTELVGQQQGLIEKQVGLIIEAWAKAFRATVIEKSDGTYWQFDEGSFPNERSVRTFLRRMPAHEVLAAVDLTASRFRVPEDHACRFFYKVCWRRIKGETGPIDGPGPISDPHENCVTVREYDQIVEMMDEYRGGYRLLRKKLDLAIDELSTRTGVTTDDIEAWLDRRVDE